MEEAKARIGNGTEIGRRDFLGLGAAAAASVFMPVLKAGICADLRGDASSARFDDNLVAFLADIHAGADKKCSVARRKFKETVDEILAMRPLPRNVLVFGDIAYRCGLGEDYDFSRPLFRKLEDAGIAVTIGMGNHDRRSEYAKRWPEAAAKSLVPGRYVHLVETPHLDFHAARGFPDARFSTGARQQGLCRRRSAGRRTVEGRTGLSEKVPRAPSQAGNCLRPSSMQRPLVRRRAAGGRAAFVAGRRRVHTRAFPPLAY